MKKISLVLVLMVVLLLSGCERTNDFVDNYNSATSPYYTQEEVDGMFEELYDKLNEAFTECDEAEYGIRSDISELRERIAELESELRDFDRFDYEDLLELETAFDDYEDYMNDYVSDLQQRIAELESE